MLVLGSLLALLSGMLNAAAAALEKREGMRTATGHRGLRLLGALARRPLWALAIVLSGFAWLSEAAALATAPVPVVATLRNAGRGMLVVGGARWLDESFTPLEVGGVVLAGVGGAITALGSANSDVVRKPLSNLTELWVAALCALAALIVSRLSSRVAVHGRPWRRGHAPASDGRSRRANVAGVVTGTAVGLLFAATGVYTKEIGDTFAVHGPSGFTAVVASGSPWLMLALTVWAQSLIQQAFRLANAASVSAANASVASLGLIAAGFALYGEKVPGGFSGVLLFGGMVISIAGTVVLLVSRPGMSKPPGQG